MSIATVVPPRVPRREGPVMRAIGRSLVRLWGWRVEGTIPDVPKLVIAVAPHTSNWDFVIGGSVMFALDLRIGFLAKHTLFQWPLFGAFLRWMGGIPVDRRSPHGLVADSVAAFNAAGNRVLAITPEGTRRQVAQFKPGFLHIAKGAGTPVLLAAIDYGHRRVLFGPTITPGEDIDADRTKIEAWFAPIRGKHPRSHFHK